MTMLEWLRDTRWTQVAALIWAVTIALVAYIWWPTSRELNVEAILDRQVPDWRDRLSRGENVTIKLAPRR
jgi:hypothetical protein